jgi:shikimate kinase
MSTTRKSLIYLTGFMGSGKSTVGPILANTLGYSHIDIDEEVERVAGKKVSEIFHDHGEAYFRKIEHQVLEDVSRTALRVISLGGGTITVPSNLTIAKSTGIVIYLKTDVDHIFRRMKHKADRPLLRTGEGVPLSDQELLKRINDILEVREQFYNQADITIDTNDRRVGVTVDDIVRALAGRIE